MVITLVFSETTESLMWLVSQRENSNSLICAAFPLIFWQHPVIPGLIEISRLVPKGCNFLSRMADKELLS